MSIMMSVTSTVCGFNLSSESALNLIVPDESSLEGVVLRAFYDGALSVGLVFLFGFRCFCFRFRFHGLLVDFSRGSDPNRSSIWVFMFLLLF